MIDLNSDHSRRERHTEDRTNKILDAAARLFAERGFHRTTTRHIAQAADVAEGTLYNYFANKDDLLMGIMERLTDTLNLDIHRLSVSEENVREHFQSIFRSIQMFQDTNKDKMQALLSEILADSELRARYYQTILGPMIAALEKDLHFHQQKQQIEVDEVPETARLITSIILGWFFLQVLGDSVASNPDNVMDEVAVAVLFDGIAAK